MNLQELDEETFKAIKKLVKGFCLKEVTNEYVLDGQGNKQLSKQKISKKAVSTPSVSVYTSAQASVAWIHS